MTPEEFAATYWGRRPLLSVAADLPAPFDDLFDLAAADELISRRGLRTPFLRIAKDGRVVATGRFTGSGGAGAGVADQVVDDRVLDLFLDGSTLVLQGLHRTWPALERFAAQLRADLGHPVQVNAYVTPPASRGFSAHYDVHDVFVLQVTGEKRWRVHPPVLADPLPGQPWTDRRAAVAAAAEQPPLLEPVLRPGDALYLPRGYLHAATALGDVSAHLTVGVPPVTRYAVAEALLADLAEDPTLRGSLPVGLDLADEAALAREVAAAAEALAAALPRAPVAQVAHRLVDRLLPAGRPAPVGPLAQAAAVADLSPDTWVALRPQLPLVVRDAADGVHVVLADRHVTVPPAARDAFGALAAGRPMRVADLPGLAPDDQLDLARRLLREAVVVPSEGPPAASPAGGLPAAEATVAGPGDGAGASP